MALEEKMLEVGEKQETNVDSGFNEFIGKIDELVGEVQAMKG